MHYLRKEFQRLVKYAQGLGIKVTADYGVNHSDGAAWLTDGSEIVLYNQSATKPLRNCLLLYHELAHHMAWVHNGRKGNLVTDRILDKENNGLPLTDKQRKHIYEMEKADSQYQLLIHHEIGSKIPIERIKAEIDFDIWQYKFYWKNARWATNKEQITYWRTRNVK